MNKNDTLSMYLRNGDYNAAFNHMFITGESIPVDIVGNLLNVLKCYRIFFYSVKNRNFSTYVVSNSTKKHIIKHLVVPRDKHMAILGSFKKRNAIERAKNALSDKLRLKNEKKAAPLAETEIGYVKNEATGRMIKVGSRKYKEMFPDAKKPIGRPKKRWDPVVDLMRIAKEFDNLDKEYIKDIVDAMSNRKVKLTFSNGKVFEFLVKRRKEFLTKLLTEGLSKNNVINIMVSKEPNTVHTSSVKKMGMNSKTNKPIDPKIVAKRTKIKKRLKRIHLSICMYEYLQLLRK